MISFRNIAIAGTIAIAGALSTGTASAQPSLDLSIPTATESAVQQAYYPGGNYGYGHRRLCYVPFFKLVQWFGYHGAKRIKRRCYYGNHYYGYKGY